MNNDSPAPLILGSITAFILAIYCGFWYAAIVPGLILFGFIVLYLQDRAEKQDKKGKK
jgi:hypothetical protein